MLNRMLRWCVIAAGLCPALRAACCNGTVAVVESISGKATVRSPGAKNELALSGLEWLAAGATLHVGAKSTVTLILLNGHHYELRDGARATLTADALRGATGPVRELKPLPPIPQFAAIAGGGSSTTGAVRFRGPHDVQNLYPHAGTSALPASLILRFSAVQDALAYDVTLDDEAGETLLTNRATALSLEVPKDTLKAGTKYSWHVRAFGSTGLLGEGAAEFVTISAEDLERRERFAGAISETAEPLRLALLADVDLRLGLFAEAQAEFEAALRLKPGDAAIQSALERVAAK